MTTVAPSISKPKGHNKVNDIQPLAWEITNIPDEISQVYALKLPDHWRIAVQTLEEIDRVSPITSLYASLHALGPEIVYFFPKSFSRDPEYRPKYWFITEAFGEKLDTERLLWGIQGWLNACYPSSEASVVTKQLKASDLEWETLNLKSAAPEVVEGALPGLVARWLLHTSFEFQLSNEAGQIASWSVRQAPSRGPEADLITWPPATVPRRNSEPSYSYYVKLRLGSVPWSDEIYLLCQPGIRRWVSQPIVRVNGNGKKPYVDLVWGREKSVFVTRQSPSWLTKRPAETSLLRLGLRKYYDVVWTGRLKTVLESLMPEQDIPDLMLLLTQPERFQPDILIVHDNFMSESHPVGLGIEAADRWEVFNYLSDALPAEIKPVRFWSKAGSFKRTPYSFAHKLHSEIKPEIRRNGAFQMKAPALIEICSSDAAYWKEILLQELGLSADMFEKD